VTEPAYALNAATDVFATAQSSDAVVMFVSRLRAGLTSTARRSAVDGTLAELDNLGRTGWKLSVGAMLGETGVPTAYATGFAHDADFVGVFEAPDLTQAVNGTIALGSAGWDRIAETEWLIGPREFQPASGPVAGGSVWGFLALWQWNDAWQSATAQERREYDLECDEAFAADLESGISIAGRHRLDWSSPWHHLGIWESPSFDLIDSAMRTHDRVADFKFTTSRHYVGRRQDLRTLLEAAA
jgi:hypothetical protein